MIATTYNRKVFDFTNYSLVSVIVIIVTITISSSSSSSLSFIVLPSSDAFVTTTHHPTRPERILSINRVTTARAMSKVLRLRGGGGDATSNEQQQQQQLPLDVSDTLLLEDDMSSTPIQLLQQPVPRQFSNSVSSMALVFPTIVMNVLRTWSHQYTFYLQQYPIRTKSITAGFLFAMSDLLAQSLTKQQQEPNDVNDTTIANKSTIVWSRVLMSSAVGLFYFGPAAHYWYSWMFHMLPSTSLFSTLQKAVLGQLFFGPSFTCIFFAISLIQSSTFTIHNWIQKIKNDLPSAWIAGAGYWPIVDLISYSYVPPQFIPLFVNICSFFWTTYLVVKSYK